MLPYTNSVASNEERDEVHPQHQGGLLNDNLSQQDTTPKRKRDEETSEIEEPATKLRKVRRVGQDTRYASTIELLPLRNLFPCDQKTGVQCSNVMTRRSAT